MRTLQNWQSALEENRPSPGRPAHSKSERTKALWCVAREWHRQGKACGWPAMHRALGDQVPVRLIQESLRRLKARRRSRERRQHLRDRIEIRVKAKDVIWSQDSTRLGRVNGLPVEGEVLRDVGSMKLVSVSAGEAIQAEEVLEILERLQRERGNLPLVLSTDNGAAYRSNLAERYLQEHRVVHLRNLPRTPQHNAWVERAIGEIKEDSGLGSDFRAEHFAEISNRLARSRERLDACRLRKTRDYKTALACDRKMASFSAHVDREEFFFAAQHAIDRALEGMHSARAKRMAEREAIFETLEVVGLITRTRGGRPLAQSKCEIKS